MSTALSSLLEGYTAATLNEIAAAGGLFKGGEKKGAKGNLLTRMTRDFFTAERIAASLAKLDPTARAALDRLLLRGGTASTYSFETELVQAGLAQPTPPPSYQMQSMAQRPSYLGYNEYVGSPQRAGSDVFPDIIARLTYYGLVFSRFLGDEQTGVSSKVQFHPADQMVIPEEVRRHLPSPPHATPDAPPWIATVSPLTFVRDLYLYWDFVRRNDVPLLQSGIVGKRTLKALNATLLAPDATLDKANNEQSAPKLFLMRHLLQGLSLLQVTGNALRVKLAEGETLPDFWSLDTPAQLAAVLRAWQLAQIPEEVDPSLRQFPQRTRDARRLLLDTLYDAPAETWVEPRTILTRMQGRDVSFLFRDRRQVEGGRQSYYSGLGYYGARSRLLRAFDADELQFVVHALTGLLNQAGVVDIGYASTEATEPSVTRLTPTGRDAIAALSRRADQAPPPAAATDEGRVVLQPNFQILALGPVSLAHLATLDSFAERRKADLGAFEYHLTRDSVYRAQQAGVTVDSVAAFLREVTGLDLPQNIARTLDEWAAHHERITFRQGVSVVQTLDEATLDRLLDTPTVTAHLGRRLEAGVVLVQPTADGQLVQALLAEGLWPAVADDQPASADGSVMLDPDGGVRLVHALPSLHVQGRLARIAERGEDGWRVTPEAVRRVGGSRQKILDTLEELGRLNRGPLPPALIEKVKRWGAYYGSAGVETVTLIEFRDAQAFDEMRADPKLGKLLKSFRAGERALAVVPTDRLAEVEARLLELGVEVRRGLGR